MNRIRLAMMGLLTSALLCCTDNDSFPIGTKLLGDPCDRTADCRAGLSCEADVCQAIPPVDLEGRAGSACTADSSCAAGLCCGNQGVCRAPPPGAAGGVCGLGEGEACGFSADCEVGLVCAGSGLCAADNAAGTGDVGDACVAIEDCRRPLFCGLDDRCEKLPFFPPVRCLRSEEELGGFRVYFEVPRDEPVDEFYRLPFPSDIRFQDGRLDLSGHPSPGEVAGLDFTRLYLDALSEDADGFGLSSPVFFQLSDELDPASLVVGFDNDSNVALVDVTLGSPTYGEALDVQIEYKKERSQFTCANTLAVAPLDGQPLRPNTTYALILRRTFESVRGTLPIRDPDFVALVQDTAPEDARLTKAYAIFAPLRAFLEARLLPESQIAAATVFTTGNPAGIGPKLREAVRNAPAPEVMALANCSEGEASPCDLPSQNRGCLPNNPAFHQLQLEVSVPRFQKGTRPYREGGPAGDEGAFVLAADGTPTPQGTENLCIGLSIPTGAPPAGGWPVLIFAHGTGGNYMGGLAALAEDVADIRDGNRPLAKVALLTFDNVMHGPRQGLAPAAWEDPGPLFFNIRNPRAARDNVLQGAADVFSLVRWVESLNLSAAETGLPNSLSFNPDRIQFLGHSQGTVISPAVLANEPNLRAAVYTGAGAELGLSLLEKKKPNDISALVRTVFGDQGVTRLHPMIGLLSWYFGPSDALPYAAAFTRDPPTTKPPLDFLHVYGLQDGFTPESAQQALVRASGAPIVGTALRSIDGAQVVADGARANVNGRTLGVIQYEPTATGGVLDFDGHFVGSNDPDAKAAIEHFIGTAASSDQPALIRRVRP